jgi:hypothetical protein
MYVQGVENTDGGGGREEGRAREGRERRLKALIECKPFTISKQSGYTVASVADRSSLSLSSKQVAPRNVGLVVGRDMGRPKQSEEKNKRRWARKKTKKERSASEAHGNGEREVRERV